MAWARSRFVAVLRRLAGTAVPVRHRQVRKLQANHQLPHPPHQPGSWTRRPQRPVQPGSATYPNTANAATRIAAAVNASSDVTLVDMQGIQPAAPDRGAAEEEDAKAGRARRRHAKNRKMQRIRRRRRMKHRRAA